jgi:Flp pilus assembly protein TadG
MQSSTGAAGSRCRGDDGSAVVEACFALPLLIVIMAGMFDFGIALRDRSVIQGGLRTATRIISASSNNVGADQAGLGSFTGSIRDLKTVSVTKVIVFRTDATGVLPATCLGSSALTAGGINSGTTRCNVYSGPVVVSATTSSFLSSGKAPVAACNATGTGTTGFDRFYCPSLREAKLANSPDFIGVYIEYTYTPVTKLFTGSLKLTDQEVVRIEPNPLDP